MTKPINLTEVLEQMGEYDSDYGLCFEFLGTQFSELYAAFEASMALNKQLQQIKDAILDENTCVLILEAVQCLGRVPLEDQALEVERVIKSIVEAAAQAHGIKE